MHERGHVCIIARARRRIAEGLCTIQTKHKVASTLNQVHDSTGSKNTLLGNTSFCVRDYIYIEYLTNMPDFVKTSSALINLDDAPEKPSERQRNVKDAQYMRLPTVLGPPALV